MGTKVTQYDTIAISHDGAVAVVTLNRPDQLNAWTWKMHIELQRAMNDLDERDDVRAIVVTGAGRAFCAGADLETGSGTFSGDDLGDPRTLLTDRYPGPRRHFTELSTPIIAAINGPAVGVGLTMTLEWDLRVVAEKAKLGFVFTRRGIIPDLDAIWSVPRMIGFGRGLDLLLTGRIFSGIDAERWGLASQAVPADDVLPTALRLAHDLATNVAPVSAAITKLLAYRFQEQSDRTAAAHFQETMFQWATQQADAHEGVASFIDRREPKWKLVAPRDLPPQLSPKDEPPSGDSLSWSGR